VGIKKAYPRLRERFGRLVGYVQLVRPFTLAAPLLAGIFGVLTPVSSIGFHTFLIAVYVGATLALAQGAGQCLNQYADIELDKIVKPYRPLPSGAISAEEALGLSWLLAMFSMARAFTISTFFGLTVLTLLFFAVFYSLAPFSPRRVHPLINTGWMAFSRGFLPMLAVWSVYGNISLALPYSILAFLWVMGFQSTKDQPDVEGDLKFGIKTIVNSYGLKGQAVVMTVCTLLYTTVCTLLHTLFMLGVLPLAILALLTMKKKAGLTENTYAWSCFYMGLGLLYILMFVGVKFFA
jgi:4-hydroxybenzoate polyprenyltransferase